jgi:hypothetical protein
MTASPYTTLPRSTVADYLLRFVRQGLSAAQAGNNLGFAIRNGFIAVEPPIPPRARVREMAGDRFFIETADAIIPAEDFRYRKLKSQDYLREDYMSEGQPQEGWSKPQAVKSTAGTKESKMWDEIVPHLKKSFPGKRHPSRNESFHAVKDWLLKNKKELSDSAIRRGIKRHFSNWSSTARN